MIYKGYTGVVEFDEAAGLFTGVVIDTRDVITFQGKSVPELNRAFKESIDDYLDFCRSRNEEPDKPFSGSVLLRMSPDVHRQVTLEAQRNHTSLNQFILDRLKADSGPGQVKVGGNLKSMTVRKSPLSIAARKSKASMAVRKSRRAK